MAIRLLMLSSDAQVFRPGSEVRRRVQEYGAFFDELHIVVMVTGQPGAALEKISENVFAHRANSGFKLGAFGKAYGVAGNILKSGGQWIITAQDPFESGLNAYRLSHRFRIPFQLQIHTDFLSPYFAAESWKNTFRVFIAKKIIPAAAGYRVVSERIKSSLTERLGISDSKITVLPITVDAERIRSAAVVTNLHTKYYKAGFIILMASRFTVEKNIGMAVRAMRAVADKNPEAMLVLVGSGPKDREVLSLIKKFHLERNVMIEGWTNDMISYYKTADLFLMTSNYEGGARAPSEALAAGLPVVMTDVAPANEFVRDGANGYVVPVGDADLLAERISALIQDKNKRQVFTVEAKKTADAFISREEYVRRYCLAITSLL
jgi:glycosyltransferase involved in cell wall biosynthesis